MGRMIRGEIDHLAGAHENHVGFVGEVADLPLPRARGSVPDVPEGLGIPQPGERRDRRGDWVGRGLGQGRGHRRWWSGGLWSQVPGWPVVCVKFFFV